MDEVTEYVKKIKRRAPVIYYASLRMPDKEIINELKKGEVVIIGIPISLYGKESFKKEILKEFDDSNVKFLLITEEQGSYGSLYSDPHICVAVFWENDQDDIDQARVSRVIHQMKRVEEKKVKEVKT